MRHNECYNKRGISLQCVIGKLLRRVQHKRIRESTDGTICEEQSGFESGRGCDGQISAVRQACEKGFAKGKVFWAFTYLEKVFDRVDMEALYRGSCVSTEWVEVC